ncbi:MAG: DivIVA domain-containing protein [Actinobacteria bacterium]|nr:DivIVA domain-containing protein [Actinomycetota bacterium]
MALKVSPQRLREVRFGEQWRGYRTDEVDEFVERVAEAFDALDEQVRQAIDRAARAELALQERGPEDHVSRTLVLAQRTADAAVQEAEAEAARLVDEARRRAHELVSEAERRVACQQAEMEARAAAELRDLVERRRALESDVTLLAGYVQGQRGALADELRTQLHWLEGAAHLPPPPVGGPWTAPPAPASPAEATPAQTASPSPAPSPSPPASAEISGVDQLAELAMRAEALRRGVPSPAPTVTTSATASSPIEADDGSGHDGVAVVDAGACDPVAADRTSGGDVGGSGEGGPPEPVDQHQCSAGQREDDAPTDADAAADEAVSSVVEPVAEVEEIPWRRPEASRASAAIDDDPFIAELRRAVEDPEPLGPRDDDHDVWVDDDDLAGPEQALTGRRRRRRQR